MTLWTERKITDLHRAGRIPGKSLNNKTMKKVSLKNEIGGILDNLQEVERPARYDGCPKEYTYQEGSFKCYVGADVLTLEDAKTLLAQNVGRLTRANTTPRSVIERRSTNFQKAMAYIGERRHLIPFFRFVDEYLHEHPKKSGTDAVREWKKKNKSLPAEVAFQSWGYGSQGSYTLGDKLPDIATVAAQIPYLPKAWLL